MLSIISELPRHWISYARSQVLSDITFGAAELEHRPGPEISWRRLPNGPEWKKSPATHHCPE